MALVERNAEIIRRWLAGESGVSLARSFGITHQRLYVIVASFPRVVQRSAPEERFWAKVDKDGPILRPDLGPCWIWTASRGPNQYGRFWDGSRQTYAHRAAFAFEFGREAIEDVLHHCDNPPCVRPKHLFEGNDLSNARDRASKGRSGNQYKRPAGRLPT